jgi:hypothetical protein
MRAPHGLALSPRRALALEAYFALVQHRPPTTIGATEIRQWVRQGKGVRPPSEALIRETLIARGLPHRVRGRPRNDSKLPLGVPTDAPPLSPARPRGPGP